MKKFIIICSILAVLVGIAFAYFTLTKKQPVKVVQQAQTTNSQNSTKSDVDLSKLVIANLKDGSQIIKLDYQTVQTIPQTQLDSLNKDNYNFSSWIDGNQAIFLYNKTSIKFIRDGGVDYFVEFETQGKTYWSTVISDGGGSAFEISDTNYKDLVYGKSLEINQVLKMTKQDESGVYIVETAGGDFRNPKSKKYLIDLKIAIKNPNDSIVVKEL